MTGGFIKIEDVKGTTWHIKPSEISGFVEHSSVMRGEMRDFVIYKDVTIVYFKDIEIITRQSMRGLL